MMTPASTSPRSTASSIAEKTTKRLCPAAGYARENSRCAVVWRPGIATAMVSGRNGPRPGRATRSGPTPRPSAPPEPSTAYPAAIAGTTP